MQRYGISSTASWQARVVKTFKDRQRQSWNYEEGSWCSQNREHMQRQWQLRSAVNLKGFKAAVQRPREGQNCLCNRLFSHVCEHKLCRVCCLRFTMHSIGRSCRRHDAGMHWVHELPWLPAAVARQVRNLNH